MKRRSFLKKSYWAAFASLGIFSSFLPVRKKPKKKDMFVHHVYFWLKNENSAEDKAKLLEGLKSLQGIDLAKICHIGRPADTNRPVIDTSYVFSLLLIFDTAEEEAAYQVHPIHLKFVENYSSLWSKVIVYDSINV